LLKNILKTSKIGAESGWVKRKGELCVISIEMMIYERSQMRVLSGWCGQFHVTYVTTFCGTQYLNAGKCWC